MDKEIAKKHRDVAFANKANDAVQGCMYADINHNCIDTLKKML